MRAAFLIFPLIFAAPSLVAQDEKVDFSEGLSRIAALGLPDMKGAEWVKLPDPHQQRFTSSYELREMNVKLAGNAWKLKTDPPTYLDFGTNQLIDPPADGADQDDSEEESDAKPSMLEKMLRNHKKKNPEEKKEPKPQAPEDKVSRAVKDATKMAQALAKPDVAESLNNSMRWGHSDTHGRLMLFAVQLQAAGETESANTLASALFQAATDGSALIDGAIGHLADNEYTTVATLFFENSDWQAYHKNLTALLEKFPRGWANGPAVAMLVSNLEKRSTTPPKPSIPGIQLKPEAIALLDQLLEKANTSASDEDLAKAHGYELAEIPAQHRARVLAMLRAEGGGYRSSQDLWLLKTTETPSPPTDAPATEKLKAMGMDGLIALAAVADDPTLVPIPNAQNRDSYYSSNESPLAALQKRYQALHRPTSRGEIATSLLTSVIPSPASDPYSGSSGQPDPTELAANAIAFWKANKDKSSVELASLYITEGNHYQQSTASTFLATSKDPSAHAAFEKTVLSSNYPISLISQVDQYLSTRKTDAKPFANAYIKLLRDNPPNDQDLMQTAAGYQIQEAGGLENYLKRLSLKVGDVSLEKMIADALKAKTEEPEENEDSFRGRRQRSTPITALAPSIQSIPMEECLIAFGKASKLATPEQWMEMHDVLLGRLNRNHHYVEDDSSEETEKDTATLPKEVIEIWKPLIARTEPIPQDSAQSYFSRYGAQTLGDASTLLLEFSVSPEMIYGIYSIAQIEESSTAIMDFARKRVTALTSGQEPEPWPNSENVSEERQEEISTKLTTLKADEIIPYAKALNRDERLALMEIIQGLAEENTTPPGLLELRQTIVSTKPVFDKDHDPEAAAKLGIKVGDKLTPEFLTKISDDLLKDPAANSTTTVIFSPAPMSLGSGLYVMTAKDLDQTKIQNSGLYYSAQLFQQHGNPEVISTISIHSSTDIRTLKDGKPITLESDESGLADFTKALETKSPTLPHIRISILTREHAEKIISN